MPVFVYPIPHFVFQTQIVQKKACVQKVRITQFIPAFHPCPKVMIITFIWFFLYQKIWEFRRTGDRSALPLKETLCAQKQESERHINVWE